MTHKGEHPFIRLLVISLWITIVGILAYQNHQLQAKLVNLEQAMSRVSIDEGDEAYAVELRALIIENKTYRMDLKQEHIGLKECMSKLPQSEVDDFYNRHRAVLQKTEDSK